MLNIALCDDEAAVLRQLQQLLAEALPHTPYHIHAFSSPAALAHAAGHGLAPDIAILDIRLEGQNGIQLARQLFPDPTRTQVIFITGYLEFCSSVYETAHVYFLLKPLQADAFRRALEKALAVHRALPAQCLTVQTGTRLQRVPLASIRYLESQGRKLVFHCQEGELTCYASLADYLPRLPPRFVQCHKSFCVNLDYVAALETSRLILDRDEPIPISQARRAATRQQFLDYALPPG